MENPEKEYLILFNKITDSINCLQTVQEGLKQAQICAEEAFVGKGEQSKPKILKVLKIG